MTMIKTFIALFLGLSLLSCKHNEVQSESTLESEVMQIHDEAMAKMSLIHRNKTILKKALESSTDEANKKALALHIKKLQEADDQMMTWMHNYQVPENNADKRQYLLQQKSKIEKVSQAIDLSIKNSNEIINSNESDH